MNPTEVRPQIILVTGASRGIGAEVATQLADAKRHVIVNYREKARRANEVVEAVRAAGAGTLRLQKPTCAMSRRWWRCWRTSSGASGA